MSKALRHQRLLIGTCALLLAACSSDTLATEHVELASYGFDVPLGWHRTDTQRQGVTLSEWVPSDNGGKESLVVTRTAFAAATPVTVETLAHTVTEVQTGLSHSRPGKSTNIVTLGGFAGVSSDVDFVPPGKNAPYHRVHIVLVDASSSALIHILYTALTPDPDLKALHLLLASIRHEEV